MGLGGHHGFSTVSSDTLPYLSIGPVEVGGVDHGHPPLQGVTDELATPDRREVGLQWPQGTRPVDEGCNLKAGAAELYSAQKNLLLRKSLDRATQKLQGKGRRLKGKIDLPPVIKLSLDRPVLDVYSLKV
jgi:hypothetical protein